MSHKISPQRKLKMFDYEADSPTMSCSGCTGKVLAGSVMIDGNLVGSGSRPFLILCQPCQDDLFQYFKDRK